MSRMLTFFAAILCGVVYADNPSDSASSSRTIFFAGDSTLHSRKYLLEKKYPEEENCLGSWCDELEKSLRPGFRIDNHAYSGCSTKSFVDSGRWARMICRVKPGDFVYIQFGHNDQKKQADLYAAADGAYRDNLIRFRDEVRARGGHTVFGTPMVRRFFHSDGTVADGLEDYPEAVRRLGREIGVPVVDFNAFSRDLIERTPQEKSLPWFRAVLNKTDMTHLTKEGAKVMAAAFLKDIEGVKCGLAACFQSSDFPIAERGLPPDCAIVVPARTTECLRYAADELRDCVERLTGVRLAVMTEGMRPAPREIRLACTPVPDELGSDGFRLVVSSNRLDAIASPERGILYAVYEILETYGGCRWYASWHAKVPERDRLSVPEGLDVVQKPDFRMRCPYWCDVVYHHDFAARLRVNSHPWGRMEEKYGGDVFRFGGGLASCHTFIKLVPPDRYFDSHPEYFSLVKGKRIRKHGQLCLTNPDVLEIVTSNVFECIRKDPTAPVYGVSQNDCFNYCECPSCAAVDAEEESHAGTMIRFVNAIAERVEREFPGKLIETLAYQYTRKPPKKTRPRHNVVPCLCTIECDFLRPIAEGPDPANAAFRKDIEGWSRLTDQLYVWDYATAFRNFPCPFPNVNVLQKNLQFFRGHGVRDIFEQGAHETTLASFPELEAWLMAKWMWNADRPMKPLLDEFFGGFYGKAAPFVRTYFEELHRERLACGTRLGIWERVTSHALSDEFLERADGLFRQALEAVRKEPPVYARNVRGTAFSVAYARFMRTQLQGAPLAWFRKEPPRKDRQADPVALAQSLQSVMGEVKKVRLAELSRYDEEERALIAKVAAGTTREIRFPAPSAESAVIEEKDLGFCNDAALGGFVNDPHASNGRAYRAFGNHSKWCNVFFFQRIATDPGQRLQVRVRCRVKRRAGAQGAVICAGLYDDRAARNVCSREIRTSEIPGDGYEWYDVGSIEPRAYHLFWISPGRFDAAKGPAVDELFIDCVELRLVKAAVCRRSAKDFDIVRYGAKGGGEKCTAAFAAAVRACSSAGGGRVVVPSGKWFTGAIRLASDVELHLSDGAEVVFSQDPDDYLPAVHTSWEGMECWNYCPLVYAYCCTNVAITGKGTLRAFEGTFEESFWKDWVPQENGIRDSRRQLYDWSATDCPVERRQIWKRKNAHTRPHFVQFNRCGNVRWEGFKVRNSPFWTLHLYLCDGATVRGLDVRADGSNNDGIDIEMSRNVLVERCSFDQRDDTFVLKSGRNRDGWRIGVPTENVEIRDCHMSRSHSFFCCGSEISGGVRNVYFHDCSVGTAGELCYIKTNRRRGAFVENVRCENIRADSCTAAVAIGTDVLYEWAKFPDYELRTTRIGGLSFKNIRCKSAERRIDVVGDKKLPINGLVLENVRADKVRTEDRLVNAVNVVEN